MAIPPILTEAAALAALIAAGVPEQLAGAMVTHWTAEKEAHKVDVFGVHTTRAKAALLREKVAATKEQFVKKQLPLAAAQHALKSYGIPDEVAHALLSLWAAQTYKAVLPP